MIEISPVNTLVGPSYSKYSPSNLLLCSHLIMLQSEIVNQIALASPGGQTQSWAW